MEKLIRTYTEGSRTWQAAGLIIQFTCRQTLALWLTHRRPLIKLQSEFPTNAINSLVLNFAITILTSLADTVTWPGIPSRKRTSGQNFSERWEVAGRLR